MKKRKENQEDHKDHYYFEGSRHHPSFDILFTGIIHSDWIYENKLWVSRISTRFGRRGRAKIFKTRIYDMEYSIWEDKRYVC